MTRQDAMSLRAIESPIDGHPNPGLGVHFFDAATGSLVGWGHAATSATTTPAADLSVQGSPRNAAIAAEVWANRSSCASNTLRV